MHKKIHFPSSAKEVELNLTLHMMTNSTFQVMYSFPSQLLNLFCLSGIFNLLSHIVDANVQVCCTVPALKLATELLLFYVPSLQNLHVLYAMFLIQVGDSPLNGFTTLTFGKVKKIIRTCTNDKHYGAGIYCFPKTFMGLLTQSTNNS